MTKKQKEEQELFKYKMKNFHCLIYSCSNKRFPFTKWCDKHNREWHEKNIKKVGKYE